MKTIELFARLTLTTALSAALFACGGEPVDADESADDAITVGQIGTSPGPVTNLDPCRTQAADDVEVLGSGDPSDVAESGNAAYANRTGCVRFIADFHVLASASPPQFYADDFIADARTHAMLSSQSDCEGTTISVRRYKKAVGATSFVLESTATYHGDFNPAPPGGGFSSCTAILTAGDEAVWRNVNPAGTEVYRIAVRATKNGAAVPVSAWIGFRPQPH